MPAADAFCGGSWHWDDNKKGYDVRAQLKGHMFCRPNPDMLDPSTGRKIKPDELPKHRYVAIMFVGKVGVCVHIRVRLAVYTHSYTRRALVYVCMYSCVCACMHDTQSRHNYLRTLTNVNASLL